MTHKNTSPTKTSKREHPVEHPDIVADLAKFGLSPHEARIYTLLLERGRPMAAGKIAFVTGISRQYVYLTLERLQAEGLVVRHEHGARFSFKALPPSTLEKVARRKMGRVDELVTSLNKISTLDHEQDFEVIIGEKGIREYQLDFVRNAEDGETQYIVGGSAPEFIALMGEEYANMVVDQEKKHFVTYYLGHKDENAVLSPYKRSSINYHAKLIEGISQKMPQFTIRRNTLELYSFFNPPILYVIKSPEVSEKFKVFFLSLWEKYE